MRVHAHKFLKRLQKEWLLLAHHGAAISSITATFIAETKTLAGRDDDDDDVRVLSDDCSLFQLKPLPERRPVRKERQTVSKRLLRFADFHAPASQPASQRVG